jgi:ribosomal protein L24
MVISGKQKGEVGVVKKVHRKENRMLVKGCNLVSEFVLVLLLSDLCFFVTSRAVACVFQVKKRLPANGDQPPTTITKEAPLPYSNLALVDPSTG